MFRYGKTMIKKAFLKRELRMRFQVCEIYTFNVSGKSKPGSIVCPEE
jgi:hypothetical protein